MSKLGIHQFWAVSSQSLELAMKYGHRWKHWESSKGSFMLITVISWLPMFFWCFSHGVDCLQSSHDWEWKPNFAKASDQDPAKRPMGNQHHQTFYSIKSNIGQLAAPTWSLGLWWYQETQVTRAMCLARMGAFTLGCQACIGDFRICKTENRWCNVKPA